MEQAANNPRPDSFETALTELEAIVRGMEAGQLPLEEALTAYERGAALLKYCQNALDSAEQKLQVLEADQLRDFSSGKAGSEQRDV